MLSAVSALATFEIGVEPTGWYRSPTTGRRRPGGDPAQEYIHW